MILKVNNKEMTLVEITNSNNGESIGLYLVPKEITMDEVESKILNSENQDFFDEENNLGIQRVYAYHMNLDLNF